MIGNFDKLGPLDQAQVNSTLFFKNLQRQQILMHVINEIDEYQKILKKENISESEKKLTESILKQLDEQLESFLGIKNG